jgi:hypothetical protein
MLNLGAWKTTILAPDCWPWPMKRGQPVGAFCLDWQEYDIFAAVCAQRQPAQAGGQDRRTLASFFGVDDSHLGGVEEISPILRAKAACRNGLMCRVWRLMHRPGRGRWRGRGALWPVPLWPGVAARAGFDPAQLSVIAVAGDSMSPTLYDGDEILVDQTPRRWRDGVHVVRVGDSLLVKRLVFERPGQCA